jgi:hypothetical protein
VIGYDVLRQAIDSAFLQFLVARTLQRSASVHLLFAFEYVILVSFSTLPPLWRNDPWGCRMIDAGLQCPICDLSADDMCGQMCICSAFVSGD